MSEEKSAQDTAAGDPPPRTGGTGASAAAARETAEPGSASRDPLPPESAAPVKKRRGLSGTGVILLLIAVSLTWYLLADRFTPFTSQARVQAFVVGVAPDVSGLVSKVEVTNGQFVKRGDPLFEIDRESYEIALQKAMADLGQARSQIAAAENAVQVAEARLEAARTSAERLRKDAERQRRLYEKDPGAISVRRVETAEASYQEALAGVSGAEAELAKARDSEAGARESLDAAQSAVDTALRNLDKTIVRAPSDGVITDLRADVGNYASTGKPVMTLVAVGNVWIQAEFTENNLGHMKVGTPVEFSLDVLPGRVFVGKVSSVGVGVAAGQPAPPGSLPEIRNSRDWLRPAQRFPVEIRFDRRQDPLLPMALRVGGQATVVAYTSGAPAPLPLLARFYIRAASWLSYAY